MDPTDIFELLGGIASKSNPIELIQDINTLWNVSQKVKQAGKFDVSAMIKDGSLLKNMQAAQRTLTLVVELLKDPKQAPRVGQLIQMALAHVV